MTGDEVLADLALIDDLADLDADLVGVVQPARLDRRPDFAQFFLGGGQQGFALGGALGGQRGIAAADQPLAGVSGVGDLGEVLLIEQRHLQRPVVAGQRRDGRGAQGGDPARAGQRLQLADPRLGDRSAVADQDDLIEPEFVADDRDDFPERDRVGGIAGEYPDRDRDPGPAGDQCRTRSAPGSSCRPGNARTPPAGSYALPATTTTSQTMPARHGSRWRAASFFSIASCRECSQSIGVSRTRKGALCRKSS